MEKVGNAADSRRSLVREAFVLIAAALLLALGSWLVRTPRLPLKADFSLYELELAAPRISATQARELFEGGAHLFIDTRPIDDIESTPHIPGAFQIRAESFDDDLAGLLDFIYPEDPLVLYGGEDLQSLSAIATRFQARGYEQLSLMAGGMAGWQKAGGETSGGEPE